MDGAVKLTPIVLAVGEVAATPVGKDGYTGPTTAIPRAVLKPDPDVEHEADTSAPVEGSTGQTETLLLSSTYAYPPDTLIPQGVPKLPHDFAHDADTSAPVKESTGQTETLLSMRLVTYA